MGTPPRAGGRGENPCAPEEVVNLSPVMRTFSQRRLQPEIMDSPGLDPEEHVRALRALARVNLLSLTARRIWREVRQIEARPVRVLDVACGGGDVALALAGRARAAGLPLEVTGCDTSVTALAHAREQAKNRSLAVRFLELDATRDPLPRGFDLVASSLFLHHLEPDPATEVLAEMARAGGRVVVQDLLRTALGYGLAWATLRVISRSRVAHVDGPRSVHASFRVGEVEEMARRAGLRGARVTRCWPQRFLLTWSAPDGA